MTGTALTESEEFLEIYGLSVIEIPTHKPMIRIDQNDQIYKTPDEKYKAVLDLVKEKYEKGQFVFVIWITKSSPCCWEHILRRSCVTTVSKNENLAFKNQFWFEI